PLLIAFGFLFGLAIGSFLNVVIYRVPLGLSVVSPPSACPNCGHEIRGYDNIPVVSWLVLRGRCRDCGHPISARYPLVEAVTGLAFAVATWVVAVLVPPTEKPGLFAGLCLAAWVLVAVVIALVGMAIDRARRSEP
ncbi:MAG: prepilin peptidase, partial [Actinomycetes bacterium]